MARFLRTRTFNILPRGEEEKGKKETGKGKLASVCACSCVHPSVDATPYCGEGGTNKKVRHGPDFITSRFLKSGVDTFSSSLGSLSPFFNLLVFPPSLEFFLSHLALFFIVIVSFLFCFKFHSTMEKPTTPQKPLPAKDPSGLEADDIARIDESYDQTVGTVTDFEKQKTAEGEAKFRRLGWKRMTVVLVVEAIGLGTFSLPAAFATLGVVAGTLCCIFLGLVVIYTGWIVGQVKVVYPAINHYGDMGGLVMGRFGQELVGFLYVLQLILMTASFCLTGTIAFNTLSDNGTCGLVFSIISGILLFAFAIMPSFTEAAILGYIDLACVTTAIFIAVIGSGVSAAHSPEGIAGKSWSAWPDPDATFKDGMVAVCNMMFAYSFSMFITPFMSEMHTPTDFMKSVWTLGIIEILVYTITGVLIYVFIGSGVESPSLLSLEGVLPKIAFGIALPLIFISGAIGNTVTARYVHLRMYSNSVVRFINTPKGWITWIAVLGAITIVSWLLAEAIPFFDDLLALSSALLISGFVLYYPAIMWFKLLCKGKWYQGLNLVHAIANVFVFGLGMLVLIGGTYASVKDIVSFYVHTSKSLSTNTYLHSNTTTISALSERPFHVKTKTAADVNIGFCQRDDDDVETLFLTRCFSYLLTIVPTVMI